MTRFHPRRGLLSCAAVFVLLAGAALAADTPAGAAADETARVEAGRMIYREGRLPSGEPLRGRRPAGNEVSGRDAACVLCHQRSGLGLAEGAIPMPPVSGPALFGSRTLPGHVARRAPGMEFRDYPFRTRPPYDDESLARAIRDGVNPDGYAFQYLMPRYELSDRDMQSLIAYLRTLSAQPSPGVDASVAHFATVVAPGMDPARRDAYLGVLKACFTERYPEPELDTSGMAGEGKRQVWRLHVWELEGAPETWEWQLQAHYARQPVFAMISGLGREEWAPVERFCESNGLPCLFPNVDLPGSAAGAWYSFYFFRGVALEAGVLASYLQEQREVRVRRVVQLARAGGSGARGAAALRDALAGSGIVVEDRAYPGSGKSRLLAGLGKGDALVLWLGPEDLVTLTQREPPRAGLLLVSGMLGGLENAPLPPGWKKAAQMVYPFDPPGRWHLRMDRNLRPWLAQKGLPRADERMQGNTLAACNILTESMLRLRGRYVRDHLVEWVENYPSAMGNAPAPQAFPRFSLGPGQRFSSKGAYMVRFASPDKKRLVPVQPDWIVP
ncbi:MAG TPA: cytochrome C [Burkholderiales bacterium]|nr:cytochrome C [Burkholderiales bacterium]